MDTVTVLLPTPWAVLLLLAGLWNLVVWPQFWRRVAADPRSRDASGQTTTFFRVHAVIVGVSLALGLAVGVLGVLALVAGGGWALSS